MFGRSKLMLAAAMSLATGAIGSYGLRSSNEENSLMIKPGRAWIGVDYAGGSKPNQDRPWKHLRQYQKKYSNSGTYGTPNSRRRDRRNTANEVKAINTNTTQRQQYISHMRDIGHTTNWEKRSLREMNRKISL